MLQKNTAQRDKQLFTKPSSKEKIIVKRFIETCKDGLFDLIVVGGGITGAAVAYDAAARGLRTALVEKKDYGWATSAATSKLIHGGLRYLQNLEFPLVRESLRERRILGNIAPNLVAPIPFLVPGYGDARRNKWMLRAGLTVYDVLSFDRGWTWDKARRIPHHAWLSKEAVLQMEPMVRPEGLTGGSVYYDSQSIHPERLTLAFVKSALRSGAQIANYARVSGFLFSGDRKIEGVRVEDVLTGDIIDLKARLVINCGGPWADIILNLADTSGESRHRIRRSEGIHILTKKFQTRQAVVMWTPAGRHFFTIPWRGYQLIGTTDHEYVGSPDEWRVTRERIAALITDTNDAIGDGRLTYGDVAFAYGGLRPLVDKQTEGTYDSSRKYEIHDNAADGFDGLITVEGGKYTTSRCLAENALQMIEKKLGRSPKKSKTNLNYLAGCDIADMGAFMAEIRRDFKDFDAMTIDYLAKNYGTECRAVFELARRDRALAEIVCEDGQILASVVYAVKNESARSLTDILLRRTGIGNIGHPGKIVLEKIGVMAATHLGWDPARLDQELSAADTALRLPA
ncbi:MAG: glycerol-3-phosphate dehydrogenase/oxidase [Desulfobacteraceae bacterium]|nr:MAG: glycerol-3-phosphate dehydrogenase/oxidase [Desulfobacteraceae bacterium]